MFKLSTVLFVLALFVTPAFTQQTPVPAKAQQPQPPIQQEQAPPQIALPVLREYRGIKLGMNREEVKAAMGKPSRSGKDWDEFKLEGADLMTARYNAKDLVKTIQLYFTDASRAPKWAEVVGNAQIQKKATGSQFARAVNKDENFWVTMFQSKSGSVTTITISR